MIRGFYKTAEEALEKAGPEKRYICPLELSEGGYCRTVYVAIVSAQVFNFCSRQSGESLKSPVYVKLPNGVWQKCEESRV